jgi:hypothetical protein
MSVTARGVELVVRFSWLELTAATVACLLLGVVVGALLDTAARWRALSPGERARRLRLAREDNNRR